MSFDWSVSFFTFKVLTDMYLMPFYLLFSGCFFSSLFLSPHVPFPCDLMTFFSVTFGFLSLQFLCICYRILVCSYCEVPL